MIRHCKNSHGGLNQLFCDECPSVRFFKNAKALKRHKLSHVRVKCDNCEKELSTVSLPRHVKRCIEDTEASPSVEVQDDCALETPALEPLFELPVTGILRSAHKAPSEELTMGVLREYWAWVQCPSSLGKPKVMMEPAQHLAKLRTVVGKLSAFCNYDGETVLRRLKRADSCAKLLAIPRLDAFTRWLAVNEKGVELQASTLYNYVGALLLLVRWHVVIKERLNLKKQFDMLQQLYARLNVEKKGKLDLRKKADRITQLPSVPDFIDFIDTDLLDDVTEARNKYHSSCTWTQDMYIAYRNYILVLLLFGVPPQRLQVYDNLDVREIKYHDQFTVLSLKQHKTYYKYGAVLVVIPPRHFQVFQEYLKVRAHFANQSCHNLFIDTRGNREAYLTNRFRGLVYKRFGCDISIRDCRSIYVTYAHQHADIQEMHALSRMMYHSFHVQQLVYRSSNVLQEAIAGIALTERLVNRLPVVAVCEDDGSILTGAEFEPDEQHDSEEFDYGPSDEALIEMAEEFNRYSDIKI
jgi:hypothetical protein